MEKKEGGAQEPWLQQLWLISCRWCSGGMEREEGGAQEPWLQQLWLISCRWSSGEMEREGRWSNSIQALIHNSLSTCLE
jgi:hypothetical protein